MKRLDNNAQALNALNNIISSLDNKVKAIYNMGYREGYKDGTEEALEKIKEQIVNEVFGDDELKK